MTIVCEPEEAVDERPGPETEQECTGPFACQEIVVDEPERTNCGVPVMVKDGATTVTVAVLNALFPAASVQVRL